MEFDPIIALVVAIIIGLFSYIYYLHTQRKSQPALDLTQLSSAVYDESLFTNPFPEKDAYVDTKKQLLTAAGKSDSEQSVSDLPAEARKQLDGLMLKRAVAAIERGNGINRELENVRALQSNGLLSPDQVATIQSSIKAVEQEHRDIKDEANVVRHNWGDAIFRQAYAMSPSGIQAIKDNREKAAETSSSQQQQKEKGEKEVVGAGAAPVAERGEQARSSKAGEEEQKRLQAKVAKDADRAYQKLMEEEERAEKKGSKKKDDGGAGSKKGSKK